MKRFITLTAVVALVVAMAVPAFARNNLYGITCGHNIAITEVDTGVTVQNGSLKANTLYKVVSADSGARVRIYLRSTDETQTATQTSPLVINSTEIAQYKIEVRTSGKDSKSAIYFIIEEPLCDGTSCPATDVNTDNICDDCGMTFSLLRDYTPSDFPSGYPAVPSLGMPNARYYLYRVISSDRVYIVVYPSSVTPTYNTTKQNGQLYFSESYGNFALDKTNNEWVLSSDESPYTIGGNNSTSVENLYSSVQIYDENGDPFFPIPLWVEMEQVTQGEMETTQATVVGTMKTLVLCGVGLIALLMVLSLFGKRSLIFRG